MVIKAMGLFGGLQMLTILCGMVRVKLVAVLLGATGVGLFSIFNAALTFISTSTQMSLRSSAVRDIAANSATSSMPATVKTVRLLGWLLGMFGVAVTIAAAPMLSLTTFGDLGATGSFMLLALAVLVSAATSGEQAIMQGSGQLKPLARSSALGVAGGLALSLPLLYFMRMDSIVLVVISYSLTAYAGTLYCRPIPTGGSTRLSASELWRRGRPILRLGAYMTSAGIVNEAVNYIFIAFLNSAGDTAQVGLYQSGYTIVSRYVGMVLSAIAVEYYPRLAANSSSSMRQQVFVNHETVLLMLILTPLLTMFVPLAPVAVRLLYSSEFLDVVPYILAAVPGVILQGFGWCISYLILARDDGKAYIAAEIAGAIISLLLNIAGYLAAGLAGLGIAFNLSHALYAAMMLYVYRCRYGCAISRTAASVLLLSLCTAGAAALIALKVSTVAAIPIAVAAVPLSLAALKKKL